MKDFYEEESSIYDHEYEVNIMNTDENIKLLDEMEDICIRYG